MSTDVYVSPSGDDGNDGSEGAPFGTIDAAQAAVREATAKGMNGDVTVHLRGGTYRREEPVRFGPADGGWDGHEVVYTNYRDEEAVLVGGRRISGWDHHDGEVYRADVDHEFNGLYEDDLRAVLARHPAAGDADHFEWAEPSSVAAEDRYLRVEEAFEDAPQDAFRFADGDVPRFDDLTDLQVYVWPGGPRGEWNWFTDVIDVESIDYDSNLLRLEQSARYDLGPGTRYFLRGRPELLDQPGEFYLDREADVLYYWPRGDVEIANVVAPTVDRLVEVDGDPDDYVRNLRFDGLTFSMTDPPRRIINVRFSEPDSGAQSTTPRGCVEVTNAADVTVRRCRVHDTGMHGVYLHGPARRVDVRDSELRDIGQTGVRIAGHRAHELTDDQPDARPREYSNRGHRVANNHIYNTGQVVGHGGGIGMMHAGNTEVEHNRIHHTRRTPISLTSMPRPTELLGSTVGGVDVDPLNAHLFQHSRNNVIAYNDLSQAHLDSQDTGLIHTGTSGRGNVIHGNRLHHSEVPFSFGFGLYLDDTSDGFVVTNNLVHDLNHDGDGDLRYPVYGKGLRNVFANNVVADNDAGVGAHGSFEHGGTHVRDHVIERNVYATSGDNVYGFGNWSVDRIAKADHNVFYAEDGEYGVQGVPDNYAVDGDSHDVESIGDWTDAFGYDEHSECVDPAFVAPGDDDYRLRYDSPARDHGIESPDYAAIGLRPDYPFTGDDPIERVFVLVDGVPGTPGFVALDPGETATLEQFVRTETGFVADLDDASVSFETDTSDVAVVEDGGVVTGEGDGVAAVTVTVERDGISRSARMDVLVGSGRKAIRGQTH